MKKLKLFLKIMNLSNLKQISIGFLLFFIISALLLCFIEPNLKHFGDSLWFCFSSVTTIGYGDFQAITLLGRIITIILSIYGIIFVAVITGAVVSYISELQKLRAKESVAAFLEKLEHLDDLSGEELAQLSNKIKNRKFEI